MQVLFFKIDIHTKASQFPCENERIHGVPSEPRYALSKNSIYFSVTAILDKCEKLCSVSRPGAGYALVCVYADKLHFGIVGGRLLIEFPLCSKTVKLFLCLRGNTAVGSDTLLTPFLRWTLDYRDHLLFA